MLCLKEDELEILKTSMVSTLIERKVLVIKDLGG